MAPENKKRKFTKSASQGKPRKKHKALPVKNGSVPSKVARSGPRVRLDELQWKKVQMPDRLDDFEGFFGLEEVDDVEVVRDTETGLISYHALANTEKGQIKEHGQDGKPTETSSTEGATKNTISGELLQEDEEEWSGFDDSPHQTVKEKEYDSKTQANGNRKTSGEVPILQKRTKVSNKQDGNDFQVLDEEALDKDVDLSAWHPLHLSPETLLSLSKLGFSTPTPIQSAAIPEAMAGLDVIGKAATGSGKTLAFGIPILEHILSSTNAKSDKIKSPVALILAPTRELAHQITTHLKALYSNVGSMNLSIAAVTGGLSVQKQKRMLSNAYVVVGTPGRLWEVLSQGQGLIEQMKHIQFLVVDEADRLLSEGHFKEVEEILNVLEHDSSEEIGETQGLYNTKASARQTLVFSATFHKGLQRKLSNKYHPGTEILTPAQSLSYLLSKLPFRRDPTPKFVDVNPISQMAPRLHEAVVECAGTEKDLFLYTILLHYPHARTLVFANSIAAVRRLAPLLANLNLPAHPLHSGMVQRARLRAVERFTTVRRPTATTSSSTSSTVNGGGSILVATDVAARGLDIPNVQLVVHYHLPRTADAYVHRSGRTARADAAGASVLICAPDEVAGVRRLVAQVHAKSGPLPSRDDSTGSSSDSETTSEPSSDGAKHKANARRRPTADGKKNPRRRGRHYIRTLDLDRRLTSRLKPRLVLAKRLADVALAREKRATSSTDELLRRGAEDLGVEYDSEEVDAGGGGKRRRGAGRREREREARGVSTEEVARVRAELKGLLGRRVNVGVSERYVAGGGVDVGMLLDGSAHKDFLGEVEGLGLGGL